VHLNELSASELLPMLNDRSVSARDVIISVLDRIETVESDINAFLTVRSRSDLLRDADAVDERRRKGERVGLLAGLPVAMKDNICTRGVRTTCASRMLETFVPPYNATVVQKMLDADGILLGKTNMDEFAMGSSTENSAFKVTRNPWNLDYVPGGTSGGSAAAVSANETILAIGSDTGGSVRQPAAYCGAVGLKPTYGRVSRYGLISYASSLDQIGVITKTVGDARILFGTISGHDPLDSTSILDTSHREPERAVTGLRIGLPKEYFIDGLDKELRTAIEAKLSELQGMGHRIVEISLPHTPYAIACYYILSSAEASSNLARYAGNHFGHRSTRSESLKEMITFSRTEGFGPEVRRRILLGTFVLSAGYYDAYYTKASRVRALIGNDFTSAFQKCDVILSPVAPGPAFRINEKTSDPLTMYLVDIFSVTANLTGLPAITLPCGMSGGGLPLALQLTGPRFSETKLLGLGEVIESLPGLRSGSAGDFLASLPASAKWDPEQ
jgi:aspartyl-tRNA(Asn)/glutamyl-tRNA(Gln) amidotransferase subunit A